MGLNWHLLEYLDQHDMAVVELEAGLPHPLPQTWLGQEVPAELSMDDLAVLCQALGCQPGDLLTFTPETPAEIAQRELERNMTYQSFLAFQDQRREDEP